MKALLLLLVLLFAFTVHAQNADADPVTSVAHVRQLMAEGLKSKWYEKIQMRGYADFRYNRIGETNNQLTCTMCDGSLGGKQGFFFRRARLTLFGEITDRIFIYIQPDYSTSAV